MDRLLHALQQLSKRHGELVFMPRRVAAEENRPPAQALLAPPVEHAPIDHGPAYFEPADHEPIDYGPTEPMPVEYVLVEPPPVEHVPIDEIPAVEVLLDQLQWLAEELPAEVKEASAQETPIDQAPAQKSGQPSVGESVVAPETCEQVSVEMPAPATRLAERRYYAPLAVSKKVAAVRDHILAQVPSRTSRVVGLVHADRAGEQSGVVAELARAFVGLVAGEVLAIDARAQGTGWGAKLGCQSSGGAETLFLGQKTLEQVVCPSTWAGLHAVPAGPHRHDIQAARSQEIEHQLACCRAAYGTVLIDLGSVDAMHVVPIARRCDATFLIVRLGETHRQQARTALARLQYAGISTVGCILTTAPNASEVA